MMNSQDTSEFLIFYKKHHFFLISEAAATAVIMFLAAATTGDALFVLAASTIESEPSFNSVTNNSGNAIILTFDDAWKSQHGIAAPILDKYNFKATFFVVCNYVEKDDSRMSWKDIENLRNKGHDIQAHTMNHKDLTELSAKDLDYELGESKRCLGNKGINSTIMATPFNEGWDNSTVIEAVARHYKLARNGNSDLMFLKCDKWDLTQTDCNTYSNNGSLTFANRYSIRGWSHNFYDNKYEHNETKILDEFVRTVNHQLKFNNQSQEIGAI
ncbi:MAG: polysaccharide deacetylase family protein, partial [Nitrososphaeraceae archaeon]